MFSILTAFLSTNITAHINQSAVVESELSDIHSYYQSQSNEYSLSTAAVPQPSQQQQQQHIIVIGAGLTGLHSAYYLSKLGHTVTILERSNSVCTGSSALNTGLLSVSTAGPLLSTTALIIAYKNQFCPINIKSHPDLDSVGLFSTADSKQFVTAMLPTSIQSRYWDRLKSIYGLALYSRYLAINLLTNNTDNNTNNNNPPIFGGYFRFFTNKRQFRADILPDIQSNRAVINTDTQLPTDELLLSTLPIMKSIINTGTIAGTTYSKYDCNINPVYYQSKLLNSLLTNNNNRVKILYNTPVQRFAYNNNNHNTTDNSILGVITPAGIYTADKYVIAAGTDSIELLDQFQLSYIKPYTAQLKTHALKVNIPTDTDTSSINNSSIQFADTATNIVTYSNNNNNSSNNISNELYITSGNSLSDQSQQLLPNQIQLITDSIRLLYPSLNKSTISDNGNNLPIYRFRLITADGLPIISAINLGPILNNPINQNKLYINCASGPNSFAISAARGKLLSEIIIGQKGIIDPKPYQLDRFKPV